jgi:3-oxoacyl-[acyl-carrier protein] reductase
MADRLPDEVRAGARAQAVLKRTGAPEDIADQTVAFCRADSVTGQTLVVDGDMPTGMR